ALFTRSQITELPRPAPFVFEVASNDGSMLEAFARGGVRHLGVDPAANVVRAANARGLASMCAFFEHDTARQILEAHGPADAIVAANCMCHIPYMESILRGVK